MKARSGGGATSRNVVKQGVRHGTTASGVNHGHAGQIGSKLGSHVTTDRERDMTAARFDVPAEPPRVRTKKEIIRQMEQRRRPEVEILSALARLTTQVEAEALLKSILAGPGVPPDQLCIQGCSTL
jgi:hypothetical protein